MARRCLITAVVVVLVGLVPLAHASPPDPTWIAGVYDGADYDDVVLAATSSVSVLADRYPGLGRPLAEWSLAVPAVPAVRPSRIPAASFIARAPPR